MRDFDTARLLLTMARKDLQVLKILAATEHAPEEAMGFHAQQAVEKSLKAWLAVLGHEPPRTHSLRLLIMGLEDCGIQVDSLWEFTELSPFAVQFRYEVADGMMSEMDMNDVLNKVHALIERVETAWLNTGTDAL